MQPSLFSKAWAPPLGKALEREERRTAAPRLLNPGLAAKSSVYRRPGDQVS